MQALSQGSHHHDMHVLHLLATWHGGGVPPCSAVEHSASVTEAQRRWQQSSWHQPPRADFVLVPATPQAAALTFEAGSKYCIDIGNLVSKLKCCA